MSRFLVVCVLVVLSWSFFSCEDVAPPPIGEDFPPGGLTTTIPPTFYTLPTITVTDAKADVLQAQGNILVSWGVDARTNGTYSVYRSRYRDFGFAANDPSRYTKIATDLPSNSYLDTTILDGTTYYYVVTWHDPGGTEHKMDSPPALGLDFFNAEKKDLWEPDNSVVAANELVIDASNASAALLYTARDFADLPDLDQDWFFVSVPALDASNDETFTVSVTLLDSILVPSNIAFHFECQENIYSTQNMVGTTKDFVFSNFDPDPEGVPLRFKLSLVNPMSVTAAGRYTIQVRKGL